MKEFFDKYKKIIIIVLIILLFFAVLTGVYFLFFKDSGLFHLGDNQNTVSEDTSTTDEAKEVTPLEDFDERSSNEAIVATSAEAKDWSSDAKLYDCTGMTSSSYEYSDVTYYYVGADAGKYAKWLCTYYSKTKGQTKIYSYDEGVVKGNEAF